MGWWRNLSNFGIVAGAERGQIRRAQMTNRMLFISICLGFSYVPMYISLESYEPLIQNLILTVCTSLLYFVTAKGKHETAAILLCFILLAHIVSVSLLIQGGTARFYLLEISVLGFTMLRRIRLSIVIFLLSFIFFFVAEYAHLYIEPLIIRSASDNLVVYAFNIALIFLGGLYLIFHLKRTNDYFERDLVLEKRKLEMSHKLLEESHQEIKDSIQYAKRIQSAILPSDDQVKQAFKENFILYLPKDIVAGDFYWVEKNGANELLAVADCTGHGVPGAMMSVMCHNALNRAVKEFNLNEPSAILDRTREILIGELKKSGESIKDGMDIAIIAAAHNSHGEINRIQFSGAQNPIWIIRNNELIEIKGDKQPIGVFENAKSYTSHEIELLKGDMFYLFTDGLLDQFGGSKAVGQKSKGKKFGAKQMRKLLLEISQESLDMQRKLILASFENWKADIEQVDDICIIGVRV